MEENCTNHNRSTCVLWCVSMSDVREIMTSKPKLYDYVFRQLRMQFVSIRKYPSLTFMCIGKQCPNVCRQNETISPEHYVSWQPWVSLLLPIKENSQNNISFIKMCVCLFIKVGNWRLSCCNCILLKLMEYGLNFIKSRQEGRKEGRMKGCVMIACRYFFC